MPTRLTDAKLRSWIDKRPAERLAVPDGTVPGLTLRVGPQTMTWTLALRVKGEGGVSARGAQLKGRKQRITLGEYPAVTLEAARATANRCLDGQRKAPVRSRPSSPLRQPAASRSQDLVQH